jgi:hypothetical protein
MLQTLPQGVGGVHHAATIGTCRARSSSFAGGSQAEPPQRRYAPYRPPRRSFQYKAAGRVHAVYPHSLNGVSGRVSLFSTGYPRAGDPRRGIHLPPKWGYALWRLPHRVNTSASQANCFTGRVCYLAASQSRLEPFLTRPLYATPQHNRHATRDTTRAELIHTTARESRLLLPAERPGTSLEVADR